MSEISSVDSDFVTQVESLSAKFHDIYQAEAKRQGDVRHKDAYADLPENIKEFDRVLARYVIGLVQRGQQAMAEKAINTLCDDCAKGTPLELWCEKEVHWHNSRTTWRACPAAPIRSLASAEPPQHFNKRMHERLGAYLNTMVADLGIIGKGEYLRNLFGSFEQEMTGEPPQGEAEKEGRT